LADKEHSYRWLELETLKQKQKYNSVNSGSDMLKILKKIILKYKLNVNVSYAKNKKKPLAT
jgi:hypothetical protein